MDQLGERLCYLASMVKPVQRCGSGHCLSQYGPAVGAAVRSGRRWGARGTGTGKVLRRLVTARVFSDRPKLNLRDPRHIASLLPTTRSRFAPSPTATRAHNCSISLLSRFTTESF